MRSLLLANAIRFPALIRISVPLIAGLCLSAVLWKSSPAQAAAPWAIETVDAPGNVGEYCSLALDSGNNPHIAYYDNTNAHLEYAGWQHGQWIIETADAANFVGTWCSLALDADGDPHISYYDSFNGDLKYAVKKNGIWSTEVAHLSPSDVGQYTSLALDTEGNPRISYYNATGLDLHFAEKNAGVWNLEVVDNVGTNVGWYTSLAIDTEGNPHISYRHITNGALKYAKRTNGTWNLETVDADLNSGDWTSIALDAQNNPHIGYYEFTSGDLEYAVKKVGAWTLETVGKGRYASIAIDASGNPVMSYVNSLGAQDLMFASKATGSWVVESIDAQGAHAYTSLALDSQGNPQIAYYDFLAADLMFTDTSVRLVEPRGGNLWPAGSIQDVRWKGEGVVDVFLSQDGGASYVTAAGAVSGGAASVVAPDWATGDARVKIERSSPPSSSVSSGPVTIAAGLEDPWWHTTAAPGGASLSFVSLAHDADENPSIAFLNSAGDSLYLATGDQGQWSIELVAVPVGGGLVFREMSLAIGRDGVPRIAVYQEGGPGNAMFYAEKAGGTWSLEQPDGTSLDQGIRPSLTLDSQDQPHISYLDRDNASLKYATRVGAVWSAQTVDAVGAVGGIQSLVPHGTSIELDAAGNPNISYYHEGSTELRFAERVGGVWAIETVDGQGDVGFLNSLELDPAGQPRIAYLDGTNERIKYAERNDGTWTVSALYADRSTAGHLSMALGPEGIPHITHARLVGDPPVGQLTYATRRGGIWFRQQLLPGNARGSSGAITVDSQSVPRAAFVPFSGEVVYSSAGIEITAPDPGATWPVGSTRTVAWNGTGRLDLLLSIDGGASYQTIADGISGGAFEVLVPHLPSRFSKLRIARSYPPELAETDSLFTIETDIVLLSLKAEPSQLDGDGATVVWETRPGPEDLRGYRLERTVAGGSWMTVVPLTSQTSYHDPDAGPGVRYRLFAINGLGQEVLLGEASFSTGAALTAWPLPYRGGGLQITFATSGGFGGSKAEASVLLYDVAGRQVREIAEGSFRAGLRTVTWDGRDGAGRTVAPGVYFLRLQSAGLQETLKFVILE